MKRLFILVSMVLVSLYMVITSVDHREEILFGNYPSVDVTGMVINQPVAGREEVTEALSHLAVEHNSLIARRIVEPNEAGETRFTYATYGQGELPAGLTISSKESAETSDLLGSYLIVSGSLDGVSLQTHLERTWLSRLCFEWRRFIFDSLTIGCHPYGATEFSYFSADLYEFDSDLSDKIPPSSRDSFNSW